MEFRERNVLILIRSLPFGKIIAAEGWRAAVGMFGMDHSPTMLFLGDGVYGLMRDQDMLHIRMFKSVYESFEGKICVSKASLEERDIKPDEIFEEVEIIDTEGVGRAFIDNEIVVTF
ncbi:hypothetical protein EU546_04615 [Candidatus Thorarchaeota archaeon]|nr:MAG: hypothetical protein EU546_04615 [Candidatus Thorarchaeota archaeon]